VFSNLIPNIIQILTSGALSLSLVVTLVLIFLLIQKEIICDIKTDRAAKLDKMINIVLVPLIVIFVITIILRFAGVIG